MRCVDCGSCFSAALTIGTHELAPHRERLADQLAREHEREVEHLVDQAAARGRERRRSRACCEQRSREAQRARRRGRLRRPACVPGGASPRRPAPAASIAAQRVGSTRRGATAGRRATRAPSAAHADSGARSGCTSDELVVTLAAQHDLAFVGQAAHDLQDLLLLGLDFRHPHRALAPRGRRAASRRRAATCS